MATRRSRARASGPLDRKPYAAGSGCAGATRTNRRRLARRRRRAPHSRSGRAARDGPGRDRADGAVGADGEVGSADERPGPAHRRLRVGILPPAAPCHQHADHRGHGDGVRSRRRGPRGALVHRRRRSSLGEWHEAINLCAARRLPAIFCVQNNQTALSTPVATSPPSACSPTRRRATASPASPSTAPIPTPLRPRLPGRPTGRAPEGARAHRARLHAHVRARASRRHALPRARSAAIVGLSAAHRPGLRRSAISTRTGRRAIRSPPYAARLQARGSSSADDLERSRRKPTRWSSAEARAVIDAPWPAPGRRGRRRVCRRAAARARRSPRAGRPRAATLRTRRRSIEPAPPFDPKGQTFLDAVTLGIGDALRERSSRVSSSAKMSAALRQRVPAAAAAAEGIRRPHRELAAGRRRGPRRLCRRGARRPAADRRDAVQRLRRDRLQPAREQRCEDPVSLGRLRADGAADAVGRAAPCRAVPNSQNTEAWFYRTPGLKIVVPSTPADARALMAAAVADPDPVLYYEHIALYRDPRIKEVLAERNRRRRRRTASA